jgi:hypothetical protein
VPNQTVTSFTANTKLTGGKNGLDKGKGKHSKATIDGTGLSDGLRVDVLDPPFSNDPTFEWTGYTKDTNSAGTESKVDLTQQKEHRTKHVHQKVDPDQEGKRDDPATVSVTVGDGSTQSDTYIGTAS